MKNIYTLECEACGGTGKIENLMDTTVTKYGKHTIAVDWAKIENIWIWFEAFHTGKDWRGIRGYLYETASGDYLAPFRGELIKVVKDTKNEFREITKRIEEDK